MKRVTHDADNERRQVVPKDFSFLSDADSDVVVGVASIVATLLGMSPDDPIILRGCRLTRQRSGDTVTYTMGDGLIMYAGAIYSVNNVPPVVVEGDMTVGALAEFLDTYYVIFGASTVSPSPMYKYGEQQVACHEECKVTGISATPDAETIKLKDLKALPRLGDAVSYMAYNAHVIGVFTPTIESNV